MRTFKSVAQLLLAGSVVLVIQACQPADNGSKPAVVEEPDHIGDFQLLPVSPDKVLQEYVSREFDSLGGQIIRSYVTNPVGAADPCPCCPDWMSMMSKAAPADSTHPGCCRPCSGRNLTSYGSPSAPVELDTQFEDILSDAFDFERPGILIVELVLEFSRSHEGRDTVDVAFGVSLSDSRSESKTSDSREKTWRIPPGDGEYWLQFREEFRVGSGESSVSLTGKSGLARGSDRVKSRSMHLSYFPDLN